LATLVGTRTAGEVLGAVNFLVGEGYRLRIPIGGWMTWNDRLLEGSGDSPTVDVSPSIATLRAGQDVALQRASEYCELTTCSHLSFSPLRPPTLVWSSRPQASKTRVFSIRRALKASRLQAHLPGL
jgi:hypothetical protein